MKKTRKKLQGKELSNWKKEKLGILIAGLISSLIFIVFLVAVIVPIQHAYEEKKNNSMIVENVDYKIELNEEITYGEY